MPRSTIAELIPPAIVSLAAAALFALAIFATISWLTAQFALGLDFAIIAGGSDAIIIGVATWFITFRTLRKGQSN
jgi:hypothetical protein